jgi:dTDP-4-dehydrorhamnose 3,5-epimerase
MGTMELDATAQAARRDVATVTAAGASVADVIDGVRTVQPVNHVDHRGRVFEVYAGESDYWADPVVYCYTFTVRAGRMKGWGLHEHKIDRYTLISGEVLTVLYDARADSPTHGMVNKVHLSGEAVRQLRIPNGVWHLNINLGGDEAFLINHPTQVYQHSAPDRLLLPWDSPAIPVDVAALLPQVVPARSVSVDLSGQQ